MGSARFDREEALERLAQETFDVLVIGGGITGAGIALDAASRGLKTALVERVDFAYGTSSKSSKMIHGGIRYLQQGDVYLVWQALVEREALLRNAPHLVRVLPFMIPIYTRGGLIPKVFAPFFGMVLWFYDLVGLAGGARWSRRHVRLSREAAVAQMPTLPADRVAYAYLYNDAQADDARLTLTIARTAALDHGAAVVNHLPVTDLLTDGNGRVIGARGETSAGAVDIRARAVVNASGVWVDDVNSLDLGEAQRTVRPARGVHVVVPRSLVRNDVAVVMPVPGQRSSVFAVPWGDFTYIGTTDTDYEGKFDELYCKADEIAYLLENLNASVEPDLSSDQVVGGWVGLRPLLRGAKNERTADLSRRHRVSRSANGVITVTGGKLTTYRKMAEDTVDAVLRSLGRSAKCRTRRLPLRGSHGHDRVDDGGLGAPVRDHLAGRYGGEARELMELIGEDPALAEPLVPGLPYLRAEARYAARHEMAQTLDDVLSRRTRARLLARDASAEVAESVARLMGEELGWSVAEEARQVALYKESVAAERESAHQRPPDALVRSRRTSEGGWLPGVLAPRLGQRSGR